MSYTRQNMKVEANSQRVWAFDIPSSSMKQQGVDVAELTAYIPKAQPRKKAETFVVPEMDDNKGLLQ